MATRFLISVKCRSQRPFHRASSFPPLSFCRVFSRLIWHTGVCKRTAARREKYRRSAAKKGRKGREDRVTAETRRKNGVATERRREGPAKTTEARKETGGNLISSRPPSFGRVFFILVSSRILRVDSLLRRVAKNRAELSWLRAPARQ